MHVEQFWVSVTHNPTKHSNGIGTDDLSGTDSDDPSSFGADSKDIVMDVTRTQRRNGEAGQGPSDDEVNTGRQQATSRTVGDGDLAI
jgi:hypothetical protein